MIAQLTNAAPENGLRPGTWMCSLDLCWEADGREMGYIEVGGDTRLGAARAMVAFLHTMSARQEVWILDEGERAYATYKWETGDRPTVRVHYLDWNRGRGKTAWSEPEEDATIGRSQGRQGDPAYYMNGEGDEFKEGFCREP